MGDSMSLLTEAVEQEQRRIERMISQYEQYRNGKKTVSEYIGRQSDKVEELQKQIDRRKHIQAMLKALHEEYATAQKMMEVRV